jgi:hypothetical protein
MRMMFLVFFSLLGVARGALLLLPDGPSLYLGDLIVPAIGAAWCQLEFMACRPRPPRRQRVAIPAPA